MKKEVTLMSKEQYEQLRKESSRDRNASVLHGALPLFAFDPWGSHECIMSGVDEINEKNSLIPTKTYDTDQQQGNFNFEVELKKAGKKR